MDRVDHDLSDAQWTALRAAWGWCAYCGASDTPLQEALRVLAGQSEAV